jgi:hypothetical protein
MGVSLEIQGVENINKDHGGVVLINHQSSIDLIGKFATSPFRFTALSRLQMKSWRKLNSNCELLTKGLFSLLPLQRSFRENMAGYRKSNSGREKGNFLPVSLWTGVLVMGNFVHQPSQSTVSA